MIAQKTETEREPDRLDRLQERIAIDYEILFETIYEHEQKIERLESSLLLLLREIKGLIEHMEKIDRQGGR